jgi:uncharacterized protein (DUF2147 family)
MKMSLQGMISTGAVWSGAVWSGGVWSGRVLGLLVNAFPAAFLAAIGAAMVAPAHATDLTSAVGLWEQVDEKSGKPESWFKISEHNGVYEGNIVKIFFKPGEDENWACDKCEGAEKGRPVLGLALIKGMQRNGNAYENGTIMDPRDGSVYSAKMKLSDDGKTLEVRGFLGLSFLGRSQYWNRLPDNAMQPAPTAKAAPKGAKK